MTDQVFTTLESTGPAPRDDYDKARDLVSMLTGLYSVMGTAELAQATFVAVKSLVAALEEVAARIASDEAPVTP